jgi:2-polyprenyl-3-methyl-5-hydroxy-6-metoxy-1,4-benzoquinol methylase
MIEVHTCPACGEDAFQPFLTCPDHSISNEKFTLKQCAHCRLVVTSPRPETEDLYRYYLSDVYTSHTRAAKNILDRLYILARGFTLKWKSSLVARNTRVSKDKSVLDFGCGTAKFLQFMKGEEWDIAGIEPSRIARQNAPDSIQPLVVKSIDDLPPKKTYSAITLWHVLEHVHDLDGTLGALKERLQNDGTLFMAVPNHPCWDAKKYQSYWAGYDVPRHLWHFSQKSMVSLLTKNNLRLIEIIPMRLDAIYVSILSEKYLSKGKFTIAKMVRGAINGIRSNLSARNTKEYSSLIYVVKK